MWIKKVSLKNFGKFHEKNIEFQNGLNVIYGENESGKTTLHSFLLGMLFGIEKNRGRQSLEDTYNSYAPWNTSSYYSGTMHFEDGGKEFLLERNFYHKEKTARLLSAADGEELSVEHGDLQALMGGITKEAYENTYCIRQAGFLADDSLSAELENYMADVANSGDGSVRIQAAIQELENRKKDTIRERKRLLSQREEKIQMLSMEAEILRKDIVFQKNSELAENLKKQESQKNEPQQQKPSFVKNAGINLGLLLLAVFGVLFLLLGGLFWSPGLILLVAGVLILLFRNFFGRPREDRKAAVEELELQESIAQITEQWKEKENRFYNIEEQLQELSERPAEERVLEEDEKSYELAIQTMKQISTQIYDEISDELHEAVSRNLSSITKGKYDCIVLDENLRLSIVEDGKKIPVSQLSRGTLEQAYLAMRIAVGNILMKQDPLPILLDETFSMYDEIRLRETLRWLSGCPGQILLFSCQKREVDALQALDVPFHKIVLDQS